MVNFPFSRFGQRSLWAALFALLAASGPVLSAQNSPSAADGYNPNVTGTVDALVLQPDGKIIVGGNFTAFAPNGATTPTVRNFLARLNVDGSVDSTFDPEPNGEVLAIARQPNGQILIGGYFSTLKPNGAGSTTTRNSVARLNADGSLDATFDPNAHGPFTSQVNAIALQPNGQILIGGSFSTLQPNGASSPTAVKSLARLNSDGSLDASFLPSPSAQVDAIFVEPNGQILIGGAFATLQPNGAATATAEPFLARLNANGTVDTTFSPTPNNQVEAITMQPDGQILAAGRFTSVQPNGLALPVNVDFITRLNPDGSLDRSFLANSAGAISSLVIQPDGKILIGGVIGVITQIGSNGFFVDHYIGRLNHDGTADTTFLPAPNYTVNALALQSDGKIVLGGAFTQLEPNNALGATTRNSLARVNADGTLDNNFDPNAFGGIGAFAMQANGQMLIGGVFNSVNGTTRTNLARLNADGSVDPNFTAAPNGTVSAIAIQSDGKILIGGNFTSVSLATSFYLARLNPDGSLDASFAPYPNGTVYAIVLQPDGKIVIAGGFFGFLGSTNFGENAPYLARLDAAGKVDESFQPNPNNTVYSILLEPSDNAIIAGGLFTQVAPIDRANGTETITPINFIVRLEADNGLCDGSFNPNPNGLVSGLALQPDGKILLCGQFSTLQPNPTFYTTVVNGQPVQVITPAVPAQGIARVWPGPIPNGTGAAGDIDANFVPELNAPALTMSLNSTTGQILLGGQFTKAGNGSGTPVAHNHIVRLNADGTTDSGFSPGANGPVDVVQFITNSQVFAGGAFTAVTASGSTTPVPAVHAAIFNSDGSLSSTFHPAFQTGSSISTLAVDANNRIIFGGAFISIAGVYASNIARIDADTTQDQTFFANANGPVNAVVVQTDGTTFVGGSFGAIGHGFASEFAHLNADSTLDTTYSNFPDGPVNTIAARAGVPAVIGGAFAHVGAATRANLARINTDGSVDAGFNPSTNAAVDAIAVQADGKYVVGGAFTVADGAARNFLARLNADGTLDAGFNPGANGTVLTVLLQPDGKILLAGSFTTVAGAARAYLARLNADGSLDAGFNPSPNGVVTSLVLLAPPPGGATSAGSSSVDQILVGGSFTSIAGTGINYLARLNYDGSIDGSFNPSPDGGITALGLQSDGKTLLAGSFGNVGGLPRNGFARLANTVASTQAITLSPDFSTLTWTLAGALELSGASFAVSLDAATWTSLGSGARVGLADTWQLTGLGSLPANTTFYIRALGVSATSNSGSVVQSIQDFNSVPGPTMNSSSTASAVNGGPFYYEIAATNSPTSYAASGLPAGLTINPSTGVISGTPTQTGTFNVALSITNSGGTVTPTLTITVAPSASGGSVAPPARLINLSTRAGVAATNPLVDGFVIGGPGPKTVLLRAVGPGLAVMGVSAPLAHPTLQLYNSSGQVVLKNQGWDGSSTLTQIFSEFGAFPLTVGSADAAAVTTLAPGLYSIIITDGGAAGSTGGTVLAEVYDADPNPLMLAQRLVNISGRGGVVTGNPLIGGFAILGSASKTVLLRAVGPGLATTFGLSGALTAPVLGLYNNSGALIAQNTGWGNPVTINSSYPGASPASITAADTATGAFALAAGSADSALIVTLPPGNYTGQVTSAGGQTGTALFEVYETP